MARLLTKKQSGFTIIELVIVMVLLGIISVAVYLRFPSSESYSVRGYCDLANTSLRRIQLQAMNDVQTNGSRPYKITVSNKRVGWGWDSSQPGMESLDDSVGCVGVHCSALVEIESKDAVTITLDNNNTQFFFDTLGRPTDGALHTLAFSGGGQTLNLTINKEGYVSECQ
ncbi:type IV pilin protein [Aliivibrio kagoshimensis]|uniref:type IV pilin protein n=1 Tax=Aliivibrio kagoshimensis TaxID=2910230 RepID=UPI003D0C60CB